MNKNWYIVYTKPQLERRIVASFNKRKIENYFPVMQGNKGNGKEATEALFPSMIFVKLAVKELDELKKTDGVLSVMHYKDQLAVINEGDVDAIKYFTSKYSDIKKVPSIVNLQEEARNVSMPVKSVDGKVHSISYKSIRLNLPSLGFLLIAEVNIIPTLASRGLEFKSKALPHY